jgi:intracellular septation protein A
MAGRAVALLIGAMLGYLALRVPETGWLLLAAGVAAIALVYLRHGRIAKLGWLLVGVSVLPTLILGRNGLQAVVDRSIAVGPDTWLMLAVFVAIGAAGILVVRKSWRIGVAA